MRGCSLSIATVLYVLALAGLGDNASATDPAPTDSQKGFEIEIERTRRSMQGQSETIDVTLKSAPLIPTGFDFTISFDTRVLSFRWATPGDFLTGCGWRSFDYDYQDTAYSDSGNAIGVINVTGWFGGLDDYGRRSAKNIRKRQSDTSSVVLFTLDFMLTNDRTFEGSWAPLTPYWTTCDDNWLSSLDEKNGAVGTKAFVDSVVWLNYSELRDYHVSVQLPAYNGSQDSCQAYYREATNAVRSITVKSGGIGVMGAYVPDYRGDLDLNNVPCEERDLEMFLDYFRNGKDVFRVNLMGQMAASDVNYDGVTLSASDLVYLRRKITGQAVPDCELKFDSAVCTIADGLLSVNKPVQAAQVVLEGEAFHKLLLDGWVTLYHFEDSTTRILVYDPTPALSRTFSGEFLKVYGKVKSVDLSTPEGAWVDVTIEGH
ncbi:MAG: hypothetical protein KAW61_03220 [candidate division Zixibacteria bacterium]|nr:hypothetical protein [candidate division Zixibacteria bacterium]